MTPAFSPGLHEDAPTSAQQWLQDIDEVVARCTYGPRNHSKHNLLVYDITLRDGSQVNDVYTGMRCMYGAFTPLVMRVRFKNGKVIDALSDGRERQGSLSSVSPETQAFAKYVLMKDRQRRPVLYYHANRTPTENPPSWEAPPR